MQAKNNEARLSYGERVLATANKRGTGWKIDLNGGESFMLLSSTAETGPHAGESGLFDVALNLISSYAMVAGSNGRSMLMRDAEDSPVVTVRPDGSGGLHAVTPEGDITLFAGYNGTAIDLLITDSGSTQPLLQLFALAIALNEEAEDLLNPQISGR